jgi:hypothetical protein
LSEFGAHLNNHVALLLESGLPVFGGVFDHLFELCPVNSIEDVREPLAVHVVPVPLVGQVLHGILRLLCQVKHVLHSKTLDLGDSGNNQFVTFDILLFT